MSVNLILDFAPDTPLGSTGERAILRAHREMLHQAMRVPLSQRLLLSVQVAA